MEERKTGISGSNLKLLAVAAMLIDHIAATVLARFLITGGGEQLSTGWYVLYQVMRSFGRIAFPIYCFLLVEGFTHTRSREKYALRLFLFALASEIPFDLAFSSQVLELGYQNVFFTLFLGLITISFLSEVEKRQEWQTGLRIFLFAVVIMAGMAAAHALKTDYSYYGVMCIVVLYLFRDRRLLQALAGCASFVWWEPPAVLAFIPIYFYNGKRGWNMKYFFYLFYPVHLLVLYLICVLSGTAGTPVV